MITEPITTVPFPEGVVSPIASDRMLERLTAFGSFRTGWDGYSAPAPAAAAIENAKALVVEAYRLGIYPERVEPSAMGGVGVTFSRDDREVTAEFYNNGTAHALFADDAAGEMSTRAVRTDTPGYRTLIDEVRKYLYGK